MNHTLRALLRNQGAAFEALPRRSAARQPPGTLVAKVVVVRDPGTTWFALAVLPADTLLDLDRFRELTDRPEVRLARETEFADIFHDCEVGAIPPFGRIYGGLPVYLDEALARATHIVFQAGSHADEVRMIMAEYLRIARPVIVHLRTSASAA